LGIGQTFAFKSRMAASQSNTPLRDASRNLHAHRQLQTIHPPFLFIFFYHCLVSEEN